MEFLFGEYGIFSWGLHGILYQYTHFSGWIYTIVGLVAVGILRFGPREFGCKTPHLVMASYPLIGVLIAVALEAVAYFAGQYGEGAFVEDNKVLEGALYGAFHVFAHLPALYIASFFGLMIVVVRRRLLFASIWLPASLLLFPAQFFLVLVLACDVLDDCI